MGLADAYQQETDQSLAAMAAMPPEPPKLPAKWNGWSSVLRGPAAAVNEFAASASEIAVGTWRALRELDNQDNKAKHDQGGVSWNDENDFSKALRSGADYWRPDPATASRAEQIVFDFSRFATKAVGYTLATGNPIGGAAALGTDEAMTSSEALKVHGVDQNTRAKIGMISGVAAGAGVVLPVSGSTWAQTIGLVGVGGPGAFVAQQEATKKILENANYNDLAQQYDPLDPLGLALSTLVPAGFGALGMRGVAAERRATMEPRPVDRSVDPQAQMQDKAPNFQDKPVEPMRPADVAPPDRPMDIAAQDAQRHQGPADQARAAASQEQIDAALTHNLTLQSTEREMTAAVHVADAAARADAVGKHESLFPPVSDFRDVTVGSSLIEPKPIAPGKPLFRETNLVGLDDLLMVEHEAAFKPIFVSDSRDLALGQGDNTGVMVTFRPDSLSGQPNVKPGMFDAGTKAEYRTDLIAPRAVQSIEMSAGDVSRLRGVTRMRLAAGFDRTTLPDKKVLFTRRGLDSEGRPIAAAPAIGSGDRVSIEGTRAEPIRTGPKVGPSGNAAAQANDTASKSVSDRIAEVEQSAPDLVVGIDDQGRTIKAADEIARLRREAAEGTDTELGANDAPLVQAAANCFLATGAV